MESGSEEDVNAVMTELFEKIYTVKESTRWRMHGFAHFAYE